MGYTHYWEFKKQPKEIENGTEKFANAVKRFKKGIKRLQREKEFVFTQIRFFNYHIPFPIGIKPIVELANWNGEGEPTITNEVVSFNGKAPLDYESCAMTIESSGFDFCKTARKPYDPAVCLLLLCMAEEFGDDFTYSSDGDIEDGEEGWGVAKKILPKTKGNFFTRLFKTLIGKE